MQNETTLGLPTAQTGVHSRSRVEYVSTAESIVPRVPRVRGMASRRREKWVN